MRPGPKPLAGAAVEIGRKLIESAGVVISSCIVPPAPRAEAVTGESQADDSACGAPVEWNLLSPTPGRSRVTLRVVIRTKP
jgi:hypothetical protein